MDVYTHEKEQIEEIKAWWRENRWYILAGLAISVAIVAGWRYWQEYRQEQAQAASLKYEALLTQDGVTLENGVQELQDKYSATPYAALASLKLAAGRVEAGDFSAAAEPLRWAMEHTDDEQLALVARARLARVMLQLGQTQEVLDLLGNVEAGKFAALYGELRGDALLMKGDREGARTAYEAALAALEPGLGERRLLQMKIDNLAMPLAQLVPAEVSETDATTQSEEE